MRESSNAENWITSYSGFDPIEDTERGKRDHPRCPDCRGYSGFDPIEDTESTSSILTVTNPALCYSGFDPIEDTERYTATMLPNWFHMVTVGSIR